MKKLLAILVLIMLIITIFQISNMYALYKDNVLGNYNTLLGEWNIKVNETDIMTPDGQSFDFIIGNDQLKYVDSEYIQAGKIAPGGQAIFDINIDPGNTDVSIIYKIDIDKNAKTEINGKKELLVDSIQLVDIENNFIITQENGEEIKEPNLKFHKDQNSYIGIIPVQELEKKSKNALKLKLMWKDNINNNQKDSDLSQIENSQISIPIKINFKQYTGEVIGNEGQTPDKNI